jgi:hypothetical protein
VAIPVTNPSQVQVVDRDSLARNFSENATNVLCQAAIGAGTYSIAGKLLGFAKVTPTVGILSVGAMVAAMTLCPANGSQSGVFGQESPGSGGQCPVAYDIFFGFQYYTDGQGSTSSIDTRARSVDGPIRITHLPREGVGNYGPEGSKLRFVDGSGREAAGAVAPLGIVPGTLFVRYQRLDGLPDNCGNQSNVGGQVNSSVTNGDTFYDNSVTDNSDNVYVAPVTITVGSINNVVHLPFSDIRIGSLLPLDFSVNIGGVRYGFEEDKDRRIVPKKQDPDPSSEGDGSDSLKEIYRKLDAIKDCVCKPDVDLDLLFVPFVDSSVDCQIETASLLVPKGSVSGSLVTKLNASAELAAQKCSEEAPVQLPESLIYSASTTADGRELFSPEIETQVVSLRLSITDVREDGPPKITLYPDANQRKFGSVSFVLSDIKGGGDYIYVFDQETYIPLPTRAKKGKLRLLLKGGLSFNLYDTGERL